MLTHHWQCVVCSGRTAGLLMYLRCPCREDCVVATAILSQRVALRCFADTCSGHGNCNVATYTCTCFEGYTGADCSRRDCSHASAWWDEPSATDTAHADAVCANKGICNAATGTCTCQSGWTGAACQRLDCTSYEPLQPCNNAGRCVCCTLACV